MQVRDVERDDIDFLSRILGCEPVASLQEFTKDKLGEAELVYVLTENPSHLLMFLIVVVRSPWGPVLVLLSASLVCPS